MSALDHRYVYEDPWLNETRIKWLMRDKVCTQSQRFDLNSRYLAEVVEETMRPVAIDATAMYTYKQSISGGLHRR